jgi:hypothetical protein
VHKDASIGPTVFVLLWLNFGLHRSQYEMLSLTPRLHKTQNFNSWHFTTFTMGMEFKNSAATTPRIMSRDKANATAKFAFGTQPCVFKTGTLLPALLFVATHPAAIVKLRHSTFNWISEFLDMFSSVRTVNAATRAIFSWRSHRSGSTGLKAPEEPKCPALRLQSN